MSEAEQPSRSIVVLPGHLDPPTASDLAKGLIVRRGEDVVIDASQVDHISALAAQALLSAAATWKHDGRGFQIINRSASFDEGLRLLGLSHIAAGME